MDFRLLGPFEVESDGRDLTPARRKQQLLLAALVLKANKIVATDDLIEVLWGPSPPATAQKALHGHVSALRRELGVQTIETRAPGYLLHVDPGGVDVDRCETLLEAARDETDPATRRDLIHAALTLFRGEPLADFRYEAFAGHEAARLEALRTDATADWIDAELELGNHNEVVPELERLVAEHPHDERLRAALMLALYRSGRQTKALDVFAEGRRRLVEDVGLEPGPILQQLERQILNQDPALSGPQARSRAAHSNLPRHPQPLIGRDQDLAEIRTRLAANGHRLWTLTGTAGTGKTRLAVAAAEGVAEDFPDGVFFVALAPIADPSLVLPTIADAVGVDKGVSASMADILERSLAEKKLLVVVDNFEHLLDAAPAVSRLVAGTRNLEVLATSREPLHVDGEHVYRVAPLELSAAVQLFGERAKALQPEFELSESNSPAVAEICRRLDGLPLAIELAAARITLFPPVSLLGRLDERLKLLTAGGRDHPERHQTLRAAIDWSHELLSKSQQDLFARLAVFAGGWTLEAAEAICGEDHDVIDELASLIDKNLVQLEGTDEAPRFTMLETIREYARERLEARDDGDARRRHVEYFLGLAEELEPVLSREGGREAQARLFEEVDNIRAALAWSIENGAGTLALRLVAALWRFWWDHSLGPESYVWCQAALSAAPDAAPDVRGRAIFAAGDAYYALGDWNEYRRALAEAARLLEEGGDEEFLLYTQWAMGVVDQSEGRHDVADRLARDALARAEAGGYVELVGRITVLLGYGAQMEGDTKTAVDHFEKAAAKFAEIGDAYGLAIALENLAVAALFGGDSVSAARALGESLDSWDFSENLHNLGHTLVVVAAVAQAYGEAALAARLLGAVAATFTRVGVVLQENEARLERETRELAQAQLGQGQYEEELARGADNELADALFLVREPLRDWARDA